MAKQSTSTGKTDTFTNDINEDIKNYNSPSDAWTQARNAINNSKSGDLGALGNEAATLWCAQLPNPAYTIMGMIHITDDRWLVFSALMPTSTQINSQLSLGSEIGIFDASLCKYTMLVNDEATNNCLQFHTAYPIIGQTRKTSFCTYKAYWADQGHNPDRVLEFDVENLDNNLPFYPGTTTTNPSTKIPYIQTCVDANGNDPDNPPPIPNYNGGCITCTTNSPAALDCDKIRLARYIHSPCVKVKKGIGSGSLPNGSYFVAVSYSMMGQKIGDWYISNSQPLFDHDNVAGSLDIEITDTDDSFDELTVVIVSIVNQQTVARTIGQYSTHQQLISIDAIQTNWVTYPIAQLPLTTPVIEKSDAIYEVNDYLLRVGPRSKFDFNYQPMANQIITKWVVNEYPENYYRNGGNVTGYMRDEIYSFFIRWIYDTGDKSASYHIPGRPKFPIDNTTQGPPVYQAGIDPFPDTWWCTNTATEILSTPATTTSIDGIQIAEGYMGYWESSEKYPDDKPEIWDASANPWSSLTGSTTPPWPAPPNGVVYGGPNGVSDYDLCGKFIRHHKMPDQTTGTAGSLDYYNPNNQTIRILGAKFENIRAPMTTDPTTGNIIPIPGIVGYEILRGSRNGNRTIVAKGILNNMMKYQTKYQDPNQPFTYLSDNYPKERLYQNYPYNDLRDDPFLSETETNVGSSLNINILNLMGGINSTNFVDNYTPLGGAGNVKDDVFSFHSPDTNFVHPFLSTKELKLYREVIGSVTGKFEKSEKHSKEVLITNTAFIISAIAGIGLGALAMNGKRSVKYYPGGSPGYSQVGFRTFDFDSGLGGGGGTLTYGSGTIQSITSQTTHNDIEGARSEDNSGTPIETDDESAGAQPKPTDKDSLIDTDNPTTSGANATINDLINQLEASFGNTLVTDLIGGVGDGTTTPTYKSLLEDLRDIANTSYALQTPHGEITQEDGITKSMPTAGAFTMKLPIFLHLFTEGTDNTLRLMRAYIPDSDFALRYHSHCFYDSIGPVNIGDQRRELLNSGYIGSQITEFSSNYQINNLYRNNFVALEVNAGITPNVGEITRIPASKVDKLWAPSPFGPALIRPENKSFTSTDSYGGLAGVNGPSISGAQISKCYYGAIKQNIRNLYGQLVQISQQPASYCPEKSLPIPQTSAGTEVPTFSNSVFGGDVYVGRYTEKNTFFFFTDWLYDQPDGAQFNYPANSMVAYPRYWANFDKFETTDFTSSLLSGLTNPTNLITNGITTPSDYYNLDGYTQVSLFSSVIPLLPSIGALSVKWQWFYLFNSGVRDFYCESEINLDLRDWGNIEDQRHYDPFQYSDTKAMFDTKIIKSHNYYKYDFSLSISKLFSNYISWGSMQSRYYDPTLAETCYQYVPNRVNYSLPAVYGSNSDNWLTYLPNNYKDFGSKITSIKSINKSGAIIFFESASPVQFQGLDQLQTDLGTKLTIGDGGLFSQPVQSLVNTDASYEYGSCQNRLSIMNTPAGLYYMCQNQGKIFVINNAPQEISNVQLRWWLAQYLPYRLTVLFPDFELQDNTISGIGCHSVYDNENGLAYFCKKDYTLKPGFIVGDPLNPVNGEILYLGGFRFEVIGGPIFFLGDPLYFEDVSWTISYDPKTQGWIGYHDWHPNLLIPGKNTFMSINNTGQDTTQPLPNNLLASSIWIHNERTDLYCNYYGFDFPFEIEYFTTNGQQITTLRSVEYILECYKYDLNEYDRYHRLDFNFDEAVIYNTEQCSGLLKLIITPKNNPGAVLTYPQIQPVPPGFITILYSKEENKYRFNQFWDNTADRGEYNPIAERMIWNTAGNGYVRVLNDNNLDYNKNAFQRKKFRHYQNSVLLRRLVSGNTKFLVQIANVKLLNSSR